MLLSEKDSVVYPRCLAPELRDLRFPSNVHRVADYMGVGQAEKLERIDEIVDFSELGEFIERCQSTTIRGKDERRC